MSRDEQARTETPARGRRRLRRIGRAAVVALVLAAIAVPIFHRPLLLGNVGEVDPGLVYRSAQPKGNLEELIAEHQPGSILNLRGGSYNDSWYFAEYEATQRSGIDFYDFPMKATRRPTRAELLTLVDLFDRCRYPLLIHCKSGADRTGLVSALYQMLHGDQPPNQAIREFSIFYGHFPIFGPQHLHEPINEYRDWLQATSQPHTPDLLRDWIERHYRDEAQPPPGSFQPLEPGSRMGPPPAWLAEGRSAPRG